MRKRNLAFVLAALLLQTACAPLAEKPATPVSTPARSEQVQAAPSAAQDLRVAGPVAVEQLQGWYNQTVRDCGTATRPAFLCSGVMLRGTLSRQSYLPWDPSPGSITSGGVSFAWIRTDTNFKELPLNYNNGYIFYPKHDTPPEKNSDIEVLCSFPFDGWTDIRNQQGCGTNTSYPTQSRPCNDQGINTGQQWISHFNAAPDKYKAQCGWNVREGQAYTADRFYQSIIGRSLITSTHWNGNNELRLATWQAGTGAQLPIQSFFYIAGTAGLLSAQDDQRRYHQSYGQVVPVIQLTLPADKSKKATFVYRESDQAVEDGEGGEGGEGELVDFENVPLQEELLRLNVPGGQFISYQSFSIANMMPPSNGISGHHLHFASPDQWDLTFKPDVPLSGISFDYWVIPNYESDLVTIFYEGGNKNFWVDKLVGHIEFMSPPGRKIYAVVFGTSYQGLDNFKLYK
ncbi:hypothetical protein [Pseudomonas oryzicola]|uniref:DUF3472 domain-containing protein n=1 Tax=Pseudomonas oryzicola TaxID=485876 RepID=A0ABS6QI64_9PSED|nr:hypothetical protein [Pseudomonas oryzicola]MBV4493548.1 hypothetical protein [Pseudomonas oryzicola]